MIVLDASAVVEILTNGGWAASIRRELALSEEPAVAPHLIDVEVVSALRRLAAASKYTPREIEEFLWQLIALPITRYSHTLLIPRVWELRNNFTAYDAAYIALAEALDATLYTRDAKLGKGHRARVVVIAPQASNKSN